MNTDWLNDYISLVETGSFSKAAERRASTHTAFSRRIGLSNTPINQTQKSNSI